MEPPIPDDEDERLLALDRCEILDTLPEPCFDRIVTIASQTCETPIALFSLVDEHRQWFKSRVGLDAEEMPRSISFCTRAVAANAPLIVEDAHEDARFATSPLVVDQPHIRFYAGVPVRAQAGQPIGTLCVIDRRPRSLSETNRLVLEGLAREIEAQLEIRRITRRKQRLVEERAVLANMILHDARGVMTVLGWSLERLAAEPEDRERVLPEAQRALQELQRLCGDLSEVDDRQSRRLTVMRHPARLDAWFAAAIKRAGAAVVRAMMKLEAHSELSGDPVQTDTVLLDRMLRNLYENAIQACESGATIRIEAREEGGDSLRLIVADDGPGVPPDDRQRIFDPYFSRRRSGDDGTGLGLAFCRLAAAALGGRIDYVAGDAPGARFEITLPLDRADVALADR